MYAEQLEKAMNELRKNVLLAAKLEKDIPVFCNHMSELSKEKDFYLKRIRDVEADLEDTASLIQRAITSRRTAEANARKLRKDIEALEAKVGEDPIKIHSLHIAQDSNEDNEGVGDNPNHVVRGESPVFYVQRTFHPRQ